MQINRDELQSLYESWDTEEIMARLNSSALEPEAENIARAVLVSRGIKNDSPSKDETSLQSIASPSEHDLAKKLWKSYLVRLCQILFILPAWGPVNHAIHRSGLFIGALWMGLLAVIFSYAGYKIGYAITKSICANDQKTYKEKRASIWFLIFGVLIAHFVLIAIVEAIVPAKIIN